MAGVVHVEIGDFPGDGDCEIALGNGEAGYCEGGEKGIGAHCEFGG